MESMKFFLTRHIPQGNPDVVAGYGSNFDASCALNLWLHITKSTATASYSAPAMCPFLSDPRLWEEVGVDGV
jgi:hypothetical protein